MRTNGNKENVHDLYYFWVDNLPDQLMRGEYEIHFDSCAQSGVCENSCIQGSSEVLNYFNFKHKIIYNSINSVIQILQFWVIIS